MSFPKSFLDELKTRVRVSDVVGRKVKLIRRGREFVGLSPFTNEKSPSFTVNDDKQFWHCFSSGEHGDVIKFLEKVENLSFLEAVERLAGEAGMEMPQRDPRNVEREREAASLVDVMEMAAEFFRQKLASGAGAEARAYLERRGLKRETIERFGLGYSPSGRHELLGYLAANHISIDQMTEAGLIISGAEISEPYDRFRNRLMFPIADARGRTIAFGGRALDSEQKAKYLNSPETPLFHKGRGLYNLHRARKPAFDIGTVVAVEGYMDVIALTQAGFENVVAPLGTALTEDQIDLLWRLAPEPILCFDGDRAGLNAAFRAVERVQPLLKPGHSLRFAMMQGSKDPDDLVRQDGPGAFRKVLDESQSLPEMAFSYLLRDERVEGPDDRARLEAKLNKFVVEIRDELVRKHYLRTLRDWLWNHFAEVFGWKRSSDKKNRSGPKLITVGSVSGGGYLNENRVEIEMLAFLFCYPDLILTYLDPLNCLELNVRQHYNVLHEAIEFCSVREGTTVEKLTVSLRGRGFDGTIDEVVRSTAYRVAVTSSVEQIEAKFLASMAFLVSKGQYAEINRDAAALGDNEAEINDYYDRLQWLRLELANSPHAGDDHEFYKIAAEFRSRQQRSDERFDRRLAVGGR